MINNSVISHGLICAILFCVLVCVLVIVCISLCVHYCVYNYILLCIYIYYCMHMTLLFLKSHLEKSVSDPSFKVYNNNIDILHILDHSEQALPFFLKSLKLLS